MRSQLLLILTWVLSAVEMDAAPMNTTGHPLPPWEPTYQLNRSTIAMPCNYSGMFDAAFGGKFGAISYDWSNAKALWANAKPMDCEALLEKQARLTKEHNPDSRTWVYRNLVKALPWMQTVREKLDDPQYSGFFLKFDPSAKPYHVPDCDSNFSPAKCSIFYHDQEQTPEHPHGDGSCQAPCDCGTQPCGEYLWDHRNGTMLRDFLVHEYVLGPMGVGSHAIDGVFLDDGWSNKADPVPSWAPASYKQCDMWSTGGATEEDYHCVQDMGLNHADISSIHDEWQTTIAAVHKALLSNGAFNWQLLVSSAHFGRNRTGDEGARSSCTTFLRRACQQGADILEAPLVYEWTGTESGQNKPPAFPLRSFTQDLAMFLLVRGRFAWVGTSWMGCVSGAHPASPASNDKGPYSWNPMLDSDVGTPMGVCQETAPGSEVFERRWSGATVQMDCKAWKGSIRLQ